MRSKTWTFPLLAFLFAAACLCGCTSGATEEERQGQRPYPVFEYWAPENEAKLILFVSGGLDYSPGPLEITETDKDVTVHVEMEPPPGFGVEQVSYGVSADLKAPLGSRKVINAAIEVVEVPVSEAEPVPGNYLPVEPSEVIRH